MEPQTLLDPAQQPPPELADWAGREEAPLLLGEASAGLARATAALAGGLPASPALAEIAAAAAVAISVRRCSIYLREAEGADLQCAAAHEGDRDGVSPEWIAHARLPAATAGLDRVLDAGDAAELLLPPVARGRRHADALPCPSLVVPVPVGQEWGGAMVLDSGGAEPPRGAAVRELAAVFAALAGAAALAARRQESARTARQQLRVLVGRLRLQRRAGAVREELLGCDPLTTGPAEVCRILAAGLELPCEVLAGERSAAAFEAGGRPAAGPSPLAAAAGGEGELAAALAAVGEREPAVLGPHPRLGVCRRHAVARAGAGEGGVWVAVAEAGRALQPSDLRLAQRAADLLAAALRLQRRVAAAEDGVEEALVRDAVHGRDGGDSLRRRAAAAGLDPDGPAVVCLLADRSGALDPGALGRAAARAGLALHRATTPEGIAAIVPLDPAQPRHLALAALRAGLERLLAALEGEGRRAFVAASSVCRTLAELPHALEECLEIGAGLAATEGEAVRFADDLGVGKLLLGRVPAAATERFVEEAFGSIGEADESAKLLDTLDAFFLVNRSVRATAARLGIHENTVRHRFRRLANATGLDVLGSTDDQLTARLALTLHRLRSNATFRKEPT